MDKKSFEIQFLPHYRRVFAVCLSILGDRAEAADAVQETFSLLWERRDELDTVMNPEAYCRTVARNICLKRVKEGYLSVSLEAIREHSLEDSAVEMRSEVDLLRRLLDQLPPQQKRAMILSSFGTMSNTEIAETMNESEQNVRQLLSRARKRIKELYKKQQ